MATERYAGIYRVAGLDMIELALPAGRRVSHSERDCMIRRAAAALLAVVAAVGLLGPAALADDEVTQCTGMEDWAEPPTCVQNQQGDWVAVGGQQDADEDVGRFIVYEQPSSSVPPLLVLSIVLWTIVPMFFAVRMARNRSEPATSGVVLTLLLGWIGLAIAVLLQPESARRPG